MTTDWDNIILLSADALRADHLSCHGYQRETSPVLDKISSESLHFMNAFSASSHTREAVPSLLTGKYPDVAIDSNYQLAIETVASTLSEEGFATAGFHSNPFVSRAYGFDQGFDTFDDDLHLGKHKLIALAQRAFDKLRNRHYARAEEINDRSLEWVDSIEEDQPFFLWNHYMDTHGPYNPPNDFATQYRDDTISGREAQSLYQRAVNNPESITEDERQLLIDLYDAEIRYNDERIGEFLDALRKRGLLEESLLVFTADHGDAFGEHGYYEHPRYLHQEITHVPLIIRLPDAEHEVIKTPVSTLDIVTTIKNALGCDTDFSLVDMPEDPDRRVFSQARGEKEHSDTRRYAIRSSKGVCFCERNCNSEEVEFTESGDPGLRSELREHVETRIAVENGESSGDDKDVDGEIERRLEALGYK